MTFAEARGLVEALGYDTEPHGYENAVSFVVSSTPDPDPFVLPGVCLFVVEKSSGEIQLTAFPAAFDLVDGMKRI